MNSFCHRCGTRFADPEGYPRVCAACGLQVWSNPIPVAVGLVPVHVGARTGLLVVRRAVPPAVGTLALPGGFLESHESWQEGLAREVREEAGVLVGDVTPVWFASSSPRPDRVLLFGVCAPLAVEDLPPWAANGEVSERGVVFGCGIEPDALAFPLHTEAARRHFGGRAPLAFEPA